VSNFVEAIVEIDSDLLEQGVYESIESQFEEWEPAEGNLETWLTKAYSRIASVVLDQAAVTSAAAFKRFGQTIAKVPPIVAAPATATSTWTMTDDAGYTIPDGTQVSVGLSGDETFGFVVVGEVTVPPGETTTAAGAVLLQAVEPGEAANGLSAEPTLIDALAFIDSVALVGTTSGGVDEENEDDYLKRLTEALQLLSLSLIVPRDFEIDARAVAGVARALCVPGYKPVGETTGNPLVVTVIPVDAAGANLSVPVKEELLARQQAKVPSGVTVYVADPSHTKIDVFASVTAQPGFESAAVAGAVDARMSAYLSSANWGVPSSGESTGWQNWSKVYFNEVISEVDRVTGVDRVVSVLIGGGSGKAFTVNAAEDKFSSTGHGFVNGDAVVLRTGLTPGAPLTAGSVYYVINAETNFYKLSLTVGGAAINITTNGSGTAVKLSTADVSLPGVASLAEPGEIGVTVA